MNTYILPVHDGVFTFMDCPDLHITPKGSEVCNEYTTDFKVYSCKQTCDDDMCPRGYRR